MAGVDLPRKWIIVRKYKSNVYLYRPCDMSYNARIMFTDSTALFFTFEMGVSYVKNIKRTGQNGWELELEYSSVKVNRIRIRYINPEKGLAEFEYISPNGNWKETMVRADKLKDFPLIVHDCPTDRWPEFVFER